MKQAPRPAVVNHAAIQTVLYRDHDAIDYKYNITTVSDWDLRDGLGHSTGPGYDGEPWHYLIAASPAQDKL